MSDDGHFIVIYLAEGMEDGTWMAIRSGGVRTADPLTLIHNGKDVSGRTVQFTTVLVATGDIEWESNTAAEVYVPETRLAEWRAKYPLED